jgi:hypothetical protein
MHPTSKNRLYASLLSLGAAFLLFRTIMMTVQGYLSILVPWVASTIIIEGALDLATLVFCLRWLKTASPDHASAPLRLTVAVVIVHALRVSIFVLGRAGPWINFDVRPEHHALHHTRWAWTDVYFASTMSVLSIVAVLVIWRRRRKKLQK